jgi:transketolase
MQDLRLEETTRPFQNARANPQSLIRAYGEALVRFGASQPDLVVLDADLQKDCGLVPFRERFPDRFFECGIAEQDMVSQASGMALKGLLPVVHSFASFLTGRANEQIFNAATEKRKIIYTGSLAGLIPATPGHSHQSLRDIACLKGIPGLVMIEPGCEREMTAALEYCIQAAPQCCYLRLVSVPWVVPYDLPPDWRLEWGRGTLLYPGTDALLFAYGPVMIAEAFHAAELLMKRHGIRLAVMNLPWLSGIDRSWLTDTAASFEWIFSVDDHDLCGGQGEAIAAVLAESGLASSPKMRRFGVDGIPSCGWPDEVLKAHGLDGESLAGAIATTMRRRATPSDGLRHAVSRKLA